MSIVILEKELFQYGIAVSETGIEYSYVGIGQNLISVNLKVSAIMMTIFHT